MLGQDLVPLLRAECLPGFGGFQATQPLFMGGRTGGLGGVQRLPQRLGQRVHHARHRIGIVEQTAVAFAGLDLGLDLLGHRQVGGMVQQSLQLSPSRLPVCDQILAFLPRGDLVGQPVLVVVDDFELIIANAVGHVGQVLDVGALGKRSLPRGILGELVQTAEEFRCVGRLLTRVGVQADLLVQPANLDQLDFGQGDGLDPELGHRDVFLVELALDERFTAVASLQDAAVEQHDQGRIDGVLGPAPGWTGELLANIRSLLAAADEIDHRFAVRVVLRIPLVSDGLQGVAIAFLGAFNDFVPVGRVPVVKVQVESVQARLDRVLHLGFQQHSQHGVAAGQVDGGLVQDVADDVVANPLRLFLAGLHRLAGLDAFRRRRRTLDLQRGGRGVITGNRILEFFGLLLRHEAVDDGHGVARGTRIADDRLFLDFPAVANPDGHGGTAGFGCVGSKMQLELARHLAAAVRHAGLLEDFAALRLEQLGPFAGQLAGIAQQLVVGLLVGLVPLAAFAGLHAVFIFDPHDGPGLNQLVQQCRDLLAEFGTAAGQIRHEQVGERLGVGSNPRVRRTLVRQLPDEKGQGTKPVAQFAIVFLSLAGDGFRDFLEQHARLQHLGLDVLEQKGCGHDVAERQVGGLFHGVVDNPQLRAKLGPRPGLVHGAQNAFPKPPPHRQNRVVLHQQLPIAAGESDLRRCQLPLDLAAAVFEQFLEAVDGGGFLLQHHLAGDLLDIRVLQLNRHREPALQPLKQGNAGQGVLSRGHEHDVGTQAGAALFLDVLHGFGAIRAVADVLLHFVQHDQRAGQLASVADRLLDLGDHLLDGDVGLLGELLFQQQLHVTGLVGKRRSFSQDGFGDGVGQVEVGQDGVPVGFGFVDGR